MQIALLCSYSMYVVSIYPFFQVSQYQRQYSIRLSLVHLPDCKYVLSAALNWSCLQSSCTGEYFIS